MYVSFTLKIMHSNGRCRAMAKFQDIRALAKQQLQAVTKNGECWKAFLHTAAIAYNYNFPNQLLIYCQNPTATAVADMEYWNKEAGRQVKRGAHGIPILDVKKEMMALRYLFDISDTIPQARTDEGLPWAVTDQNWKPVWDKIIRDNQADSIQNALLMLSTSYVAQRRGMFLHALAQSADGSSLQWAKPEDQQQLFLQLITQSCLYMAALRCGVDTQRLDLSAFDSVGQFDTKALAFCLGSACQRASKPLMHQIGSIAREIDSVARKEKVRYYGGEQAITNQNKEADHGVQNGERVRDPEPDAGRNAEAGDRQVRQYAQEISGGGSTDPVRDDADGGNAVPASGRDQQRSEPADRADRAAADAADRSARPESRPAGLDAEDERTESPSRGTGDEANLQPVTEPPLEESVQTPSSFSIPTPDLPPLDDSLILGLLAQQSSTRADNADILAYFEKHADLASRSEFCRTSYKQIYTQLYVGERMAGFIRHDQYLELWEGNYLTKSAQSNLTWDAVSDKIAAFEDNDTLAEQGIAGASFEDFISEAEEAFAEQHAPQKAPEKKPLAVGDTVYLENDHPFTVEEIGIFDVHLRDEDFPLIGRAINRAEFARLLAANPKNNALAAPDTVVEGQVIEETDTPEEPSEEPAEETSSGFGEQVLQAAELIALKEAYLPNNYIPPQDPAPPRTPREKFAANITAIRTLKSIEKRMADGGPHANGEEQEILAQYSGWGGLSDAFEPNKDSWHSEYTELKSLLTEEEYAAARSSTLTAFYTPPEVIDAMYTALRKMGVGAGTILEPSMGVGAFFGQSHSYLYEPTTRLFGVELDSLTGRIARQLYQKANIQITGFEKADLPDSFFDVVIGNVPFGDYSVVDPQYNRLHFKIHDYFFAKSIDKLRTGGIIAFITTSGTLDKKSEEVRRYINARCDFIGAVRLPDSTFKSAGTKAMADIIFLQKRDRILEQDASWLHTTQTEDGLSLNSYFAEHPEMVCGTLKTVSGPYGQTLTCEAFADKPLHDVLQEAMSHLHGEFHFQDIELQESSAVEASIPAEPDVRNFSFCIRNGKFYYRENAIMREVSLGATSAARMRLLIELRDTTRELIQAQLEDMPDEVITELQAKLNRQYDHYHTKFGLINSRGASLDMRDDSGYFLLCSLENLDSEGNFIGKSDMFTKRTIRAARPAERVETASEALALSVGERAGIDFGYMQQLTGKDKETLIQDLQGVIFADPLEKNSDGEPRYYTADEYLSGDVRHKLQVAKLAAQNNPAFAVNVQALETVQPKDLEASEIAVRLGATWLAPELIKQFADELVDAPYYVRDRVKVLYIPLTGVWNVTNKSYTGGNIKATVTYGTQRANFYHILEESLNLRDVRIFDTKEDMQGNKIRVLNAAATQEAQMKQQQIEDAFKDWIWKDPTRRQMLVKEYNERFNSLRPREYDGSHILFHGMSPEITLRPHQKNAIAHILYGGNTLLAHVVGAGKTYEMVAAAMEKKRLGLCTKTLICVPNHLTEQLAGEALQLYPNANILVARRTDFEKANRKRFCAKIATGNYDIIVIGHSQFERIPLSQERQVEYLQSQIHDVINQVAQLKEERAENFTVKQMERMRKQLEKKLDKLNDQSRKDNVVTFEQLGVDSLMVDEAHAFKNLAVLSKMRNVAGISQTESQRASDLYMKCRYLDEITGSRGVVFATGTPISNSMAELFTMQRYLQRETLEQHGLSSFDAWASTFGETVTAVELAPEGTGYRTKTRFSKFYNLPELMSMFKQVADVQTADMLNLPVPKLVGGKPINVALPPSPQQKQMVADLADRAEEIRAGNVDPTEDNMLKVTNDGRKLALDQRLIDPNLPENPNDKVHACAENVYRIWSETKDKKLTQLVFCDLSTPKPDGFNVYDDLRNLLISMGIPENEVQFIHSANTEVKKAELFAKVRSGDVRVLMGSTGKMGAGTNVQRLLVATHHLDCGWKPSDIEQRNGRMIRQGNTNAEVYEYRYVTESSFDSYMWQLLETKQKFIGQIMTSKSPARSADDLDDAALSYAEVKALAAGNPMIKEKMDLDIQVARLKTLKTAYNNEHYRLEDAITQGFPAEMRKTAQQLENAKADTALLQQNTKRDADGKDVFAITLMDTIYTKREDAGKVLLGLLGMAMNRTEPVSIGRYKGFDLQIAYFAMDKMYLAYLVGNGINPVQLGADAVGNTMRLDNCLHNLPQSVTDLESKLVQLQKQLENAKEQLAQPFAQADELAEKSKRLAELEALLNLNEKDIVLDTVPDEDQQCRSDNRQRGQER